MKEKFSNGWREWDTSLKFPDIIVSAVGVHDFVVTRPMVERAMVSRGNRALFLMDLGHAAQH